MKNSLQYSLYLAIFHEKYRAALENSANSHLCQKVYNGRSHGERPSDSRLFYSFTNIASSSECRLCSNVDEVVRGEELFKLLDAKMKTRTMIKKNVKNGYPPFDIIQQSSCFCFVYFLLFKKKFFK